MPPKRKRAEEATNEVTSSTRATRSSTRLSSGSIKEDTPAPSKPAPAKKAAPKAAPKASEQSSEAPAAKKAKTKATATKPPAKPKKTKKPVISSDDGDSDSTVDDAPVQSTSKSIPAPVPVSVPVAAPKVAPAAKSKPKVAVATPAPIKPQASISKFESYSADRAASLFNKYADEDDPTVIGPEGFETLCADAQIPLDGALPLILAWQFNGTEMAKFTKEQWTKGTDSLKVSSLPQLAAAVSDLEQLLVQGKPAAKVLGGKKDPYDKFAYSKYAADPKAAFQTLYTYCFTLAKSEQSRNIEMETSAAFWSVLLVPQYPIMADVLEFIAEKGSYKATNKDLWSMMLEFCRTVNPNLQDYEADGAWPTLLDDFVAWKKSKLANGTEPAE